jgi:DNA/RNA endonuclease YhcR with UshA esterase domain
MIFSVRRRPTIRALVVIFVLALGAAPTRAETVIAAPDATKHVGETLTVEGTVSEVHHDYRSGVTFIDLNGRFPNQAFTGVIFKDDAKNFPNVDSLTGKVVDINGPITLYKGRVEIILHDATQIKVK